MAKNTAGWDALQVATFRREEAERELLDFVLAKPVGGPPATLQRDRLRRLRRAVIEAREAQTQARDAHRG